jgi:F420-non-reducing hydrogenase iron-sulfur subunit
MIIKELHSISLDTKLCSRCYVCYSVCPFEAISLNQDKIPVIDTQKCMLCGICASACPSGIITLQEYDARSLIKVLDTEKSSGKTSLVVACRGSTSPDCESSKGSGEQNAENRIFLRVPCVGRLPLDFYLTALSYGINNILTIQCNHPFCRFINGSLTNYSRIYALRRILGILGYAEGTLTMIAGTNQANYYTADCVGCDKCVHICPYEAISSGPMGTPSINYDKCTGCGACTLVCPHLALEIRGFEFKHIFEKIEISAGKIKKSDSFNPAILVFCCQWAEFGNLDPQNEGFIRPNSSIIEIPCFSKLDPINILQAFHQGFEGVLAIICSDDDCKSKDSRSAAGDNMLALEAALKRMGLESRFSVYRTSPRNSGDFEREIESFSDKIASMQKEEVR